MADKRMVEVAARAILAADVAEGEHLMDADVPERYATMLAEAALDAIAADARRVVLFDELWGRGANG